MAEGARLEIVCAVTPYRGFESHPLRQLKLLCGEVPEWSNGAVSKTVDRASGPWVRIPPSPPIPPEPTIADRRGVTREAQAERRGGREGEEPSVLGRGWSSEGLDCQ